MSGGKRKTQTTKESSFGPLGRDERIFKSEYKLLNYKEAKLRNGLPKQEALINTQRDFLGRVLEGESRPSGYYQRHLVKTKSSVLGLPTTSSTKFFRGGQSSSI